VGGGELLSTLDDDFPLGGGVADTMACVICPYCGADVEITLDPGGGSVQRYVEDCEVCCRPWQLTVTWDPAGGALVDARTEDA
jgi:hypothetical protein